LEIQKNWEDDTIELFLNGTEVKSDKIKEEIKNDVKKINENIEEISSQISNNLKSEWKLDRISKINLALLKLAIYEMLYKKVPYKVVINEVVELAKKYGEDTSKSFINGVLATVVKKKSLAEDIAEE
jgi:N utilization substance protein B